MNELLNSIRLLGRVTAAPEYDHTVLGEAFYRMELSAGRLSGNEDVIPITVPGRLMTCLGEFPAVGSVVSVNGQIRSYNHRQDGQSRLAVTVFAKELTPVDRREAEQDLNEAELTGHICKPVVYRLTPFSREIADMLLAVNRRYGRSDYLPCIAWGRNARFAGSLSAGDTITIKGRLQSRQYTKALPGGETEQRMAYEISCSSIERREV